MIDVRHHLASPAGTYATRRLDLFCTWAALRALRRLGALGEVDRDAIIAAVGSRRVGGGYSVASGGLPDAWATRYAVEILVLLDAPTSPRADRFLRDLCGADGLQGMTPGEDPSIWSVAFGTAALAALDRPVPEAPAVAAFLVGCQDPVTGLIGFSPAEARRASVNARAVGFACETAARLPATCRASWDRSALAAGVASLQVAGGFRLTPTTPEPCLWGTGNLVMGTRAVDLPVPHAEDVIAFVHDQADAQGGYRRGPAFDTADVFATDHATAVLEVLGERLDAAHSDRTIEFLLAATTPDGGFTYCPAPLDADALMTGWVVLSGSSEDHATSVAWLASRTMPGEPGGIPYMDGRGAEQRSTLAVLRATAGAGPDTEAVAAWVAGIQHPDGGCGWWAGRGRTVAALTVALDLLSLCGVAPAEVLDTVRAAEFLNRCRVPDGTYRPVPGAPGATALATAQGLRAEAALGGAPAPDLLRQWAHPQGGFAERLGVPTLSLTLEAAATATAIGAAPVTAGSYRSFLEGIARPDGWAFSSASPESGGPLAAALAAELHHAAAEQPVLPLTI